MGFNGYNFKIQVLSCFSPQKNTANFFNPPRKQVAANFHQLYSKTQNMALSYFLTRCPFFLGVAPFFPTNSKKKPPPKKTGHPPPPWHDPTGFQPPPPSRFRHLPPSLPFFDVRLPEVQIAIRELSPFPGVGSPGRRFQRRPLSRTKGTGKTYGGGRVFPMKSSSFEKKRVDFF